jgi:mRNA interferase YafQ
MFEVITTKTFEKDYAKAARRGKSLDKINQIILLLKKGQKLDLKYRDHKLIGNYDGCRNCHIEPDWIIIYKISKNLLILQRTGTHSDLFKK